jgi:CheY-like chemotaxis protein
MAKAGISFMQVEDDAQAVFLQQQAFEAAGIHDPVYVVTDGQHAIDYLAGRKPFADRQKHPLPSLLLLKVRLPRLPGLEVLQWIRAQPSLRALIVIALDQWERPSDLERAYELGANSCASLPLDRDGWVDLARSLKTWWLVKNRFATSRRTGWRLAGATIRASV